MGVNAKLVDGKYYTTEGMLSHFTERELYRGSNWYERFVLPQVKQTLIDMMEELRLDVHVPVRPSSGVRSKRMNRLAGGDPTSLHLTGGAVDSKFDGYVGWKMVPPLERVTLSGTVGRWGIYHREIGGHCHMDIDTERPRRRFVVMPSDASTGSRFAYYDLEEWCEHFFPGISLSKISTTKANKALGF